MARPNNHVVGNQLITQGDPMNTANYKQVLDQITQHPETWKQTAWHCGTQHCFAGWAQVLSGQPANNLTVRRDARIFLDLTYNEANWLFSPDTSLDDFESFLNHQSGYHRAGYDRAGYDQDGYDQDGFDRDNKPRP